MKWKLLLIDDDESDRLCFQRILRTEGIDAELRVALGGRQALDILASAESGGDAASPDLILLDLNMDEMDGFETLRQLKSSSTTNSIPVVIFTTSSSVRDIRSCYALGASSYIVKPAALDDYVRIVTGLKRYWADLVAKPHPA